MKAGFTKEIFCFDFYSDGRRGLTFCKDVGVKTFSLLMITSSLLSVFLKLAFNQSCNIISVSSHQYCKTNHLHSTNPAISSQYFHQYCKLSILVMWRFHYLVDVVGWVRWNPQHICLVLHSEGKGLEKLFMFLASQDALEVMLVTNWLSGR